MNRPVKIPTGFDPPAQGCSNPGHRVAVMPQPQWGCAIIGTPQGHNPAGVDNHQSHGPRVARSSLPWALLHNPFGIAHATTSTLFRKLFGIEQSKIPTEFHSPAHGCRDAATWGERANIPTTLTGLRQPA
jgi:hypothetical protein